jgi:hypothetical protein
VGNLIDYVILDDIKAFNTLHEKIKKERGYPIIGRNAKTGLLDPTKQQTTEFTTPLMHADGRVALSIDKDVDVTGLVQADKDWVKTDGFESGLETNNVQENK